MFYHDYWFRRQIFRKWTIGSVPKVIPCEICIAGAIAQGMELYSRKFSFPTLCAVFGDENCAIYSPIAEPNPTVQSSVRIDAEIWLFNVLYGAGDRVGRVGASSAHICSAPIPSGPRSERGICVDSRFVGGCRVRDDGDEDPGSEFPLPPRVVLSDPIDSGVSGQVRKEEPVRNKELERVHKPPEEEEGGLAE